jgi:hypothetical protein
VAHRQAEIDRMPNAGSAHRCRIASLYIADLSFKTCFDEWDA